MGTSQNRRSWPRVTQGNLARLSARIVFYFAKATGAATIAAPSLAKLLELDPSDREGLELVITMVVAELGDQLPARWDPVEAVLHLGGGKATTTKPTTNNTAANAAAVFNHWIQATGRDRDRVKFTGTRLARVRSRLAEGYTVEDLKGAIDGCVASPWHNGSNPDGKRWDDLELIARSGEKVEWFRDSLQDRKRSNQRNGNGQADVDLAELIYGGGTLDVVIQALAANPSQANRWVEAVGSEHGITQDRVVELIAQARARGTV